MKFILLGAIDRVNYGDNLFAVLLESLILKVFGDQGKVKSYGVLASDLEWYGAIPTEPIKKLYDDPFTEGARVIVVGGEVLGARWANIYQFCSTIFQTLYTTRAGKRFIKQEWVRKYLGGRGEFPFVPTSDMFKYEVSIVYNAVGGGRNSVVAKKIVPLLEKANYKSFRDQNTFDSLKDAGLREGHLTPDSAILMSTVFELEVIKENVNKEVANYVHDNSYLFFQIGYFKGGQKVNLVADQITNLLEQTNYSICLCPIGLAAGHDDQIALANIYKILLKSPYSDRVTLFEKPNLWDTMFLISESSCYLGTSLHGVITAQSFSVPYLLINHEVKKAVEYMETWGVGSSEATSSRLENFGDKFLTLPLTDLREIVASKTVKQIAMAQENIACVLGVKTATIIKSCLK